MPGLLASEVMEHVTSDGPLNRVRIVELGGIGPTPFAGMLLAGLGADVLRIERATGYDGGAPVDARFQLLNRGRRHVPMDLKAPGSPEAVLRLVERADALVEGFRPARTTCPTSTTGRGGPRSTVRLRASYSSGGLPRWLDHPYPPGGPGPSRSSGTAPGAWVARCRFRDHDGGRAGSANTGRGRPRRETRCNGYSAYRVRIATVHREYGSATNDRFATARRLSSRASNDSLYLGRRPSRRGK